MTTRRLAWLRSTAVLLTLHSAHAVHAQGLAGRVALEGIGSVSTTSGALDDPMVILDLDCSNGVSA